MAVEIMNTGKLPESAYRYYDQNGNLTAPKPKMSYASEFEPEYLEAFKRYAPRPEDIFDKKTGTLKSSYIYDLETSNQIKHIKGDLLGDKNVRVEDYSIDMPILEKVDGGIITPQASVLKLPNLKSCDYIYAENAYDVEIKNLEKCNSIRASEANSLIAPKLTEVSRVIFAHQATEIDLSGLVKCKDIRSEQTMDRAKVVKLPNLEECDGIHLNIGYGGYLDLPKLRKSDSVWISTSDKNTGEVYLPKLKTSNRLVIRAGEVHIPEYYPSTLKNKHSIISYFSIPEAKLIESPKETLKIRAQNDKPVEGFTFIDSETGKVYRTKSTIDYGDLIHAFAGQAAYLSGVAYTPEQVLSALEVENQTDLAQSIQFMPKSEVRKDERTERSGAELTASLVASGTSLESFGKGTLIQLAESYGIDIPKDATRGEIIDAINERPTTEEPVKVGAKQDNRNNVGISFMPKNEEEFSYRGNHQAPDKDSGAPMHEMTRGIYPDDLYTLPFDTALQYYGDADESGYSRESLSAIRSAQGDPKAKIKIYRAVPKYVGETDPVKTKEVEDRISRYEKLARLNPTSDYFRKELDNALAERPQTIDSINAGDWVTPSRTYAREHGEAALRGEYKILSKSVPASHLFTEGNSLSEFGYNPPAKKGDISFMPSSKLDEAHADLEKRYKAGDKAAIKEAQRLVDEAAKEAGYGEKVWHGSNRKFNSFDPSKTDDPQGFWFTKSKSWASRHGIPSEYHLKDGRDFGGGDDRTTHNPNDIKSADPFTYDDNGNLIPPSQRFNPESNDIRFMPYSPVLPKTEDGKIDWEGFKVKTQEIAKPLARLAPIGGVNPTDEQK
jgi:hypothetical protein